MKISLGKYDSMIVTGVAQHTRTESLTLFVKKIHIHTVTLIATDVSITFARVLELTDCVNPFLSTVLLLKKHF